MKAFKSGILALGLLAASMANADLGAGSSGGGQSKNGKLRDLVDRVRIVEIKTGEQVIADLSTYNRAMEILSSVHLGLAGNLVMEIDKARFYFLDAALNESVISGQDGIAKNNEVWEQAGIRVSKDGRTEVYVSLPEYRLMDEVNRSYFVLHEMLHGLIKGDSPVKYLKLRNFVAYVASLAAENRVPSVEEVERVMAENDVEADSLLSTLYDALEKQNDQKALKVLAQIDTNEHEGEIFFHAAANNGAVVVRAMAERGVDLNTPYRSFDLTALAGAVKNGHAETVKTLIELGVDVNFHPKPEKDSSYHAASYGRYSPLEFVLPAWYNKNTPYAKRIEIAQLIVSSEKFDRTNRKPLERARKVLGDSRDPNKRELLRVIEAGYGEEDRGFKWPWSN